VILNNGKVNAIDNQLAMDLCEVFEDLEKDDKVKGVILTGRPNCFSAGLDVVNMTRGRENSTIFWNCYLKALQRLVRFPKPFVCAITGYAPAGATILTLCADYRVMGRGAKHVMGMHELKMGMQIPEKLLDIYAYYLGEPKAWEAIQNQKLYTSDEALKMGLVHESAEVEEVMFIAENQIKKLINIYSPVFQKTKRYSRKKLLEIVDRDIDKMTEEILKDWEDPNFKEILNSFINQLKSK
jgi:3,2-trans-enoyl-CoA isomerase